MVVLTLGTVPWRRDERQVSLCQVSVSWGQSTAAGCVLTRDNIPEPSLPGVHTLHLIQLAERWNVSAEELLADLPLTLEWLSDPASRVPIGMAQKLAERACALTGEPGLGFYMGLQMRISAHGHLGFAAMTASNIREALELAVRFTPTRTTALALRLHVAGRAASLVIEERYPLETAREFIITSLLVGIWQIGNALTGRELTGSADFTFPEPEYFTRFTHLAPGEVRFSQPANQLIFDAAALDLPLTMADPTALRLAREQCERELDTLGYDGQVVSRVRALMARGDEGFLTLDELAKRMSVSARTLKRKLADRGTSYSALLDDQRREKALLLLRSPHLSVDEVADRLGYSDAANFTRAFRRWTGKTPNAFRRSERSGRAPEQ
jgi:AraC-like DNA-binding protein